MTSVRDAHLARRVEVAEEPQRGAIVLGARGLAERHEFGRSVESVRPGLHDRPPARADEREVVTDVDCVPLLGLGHSVEGDALLRGTVRGRADVRDLVLVPLVKLGNEDRLRDGDGLGRSAAPDLDSRKDGGSDDVERADLDVARILGLDALPLPEVGELKRSEAVVGKESNDHARDLWVQMQVSASALTKPHWTDTFLLCWYQR